ncbi:hypothetical protein [Microseira wollei]|uniref:PEP-CTERM protein-sorting domain-containing protein n=1 Tax=Microseira wollei NIES-4236 TaxID=2530354 RepID=A0AAV3X3C3_9CYAN|nr:hypothetical protein [Microseira wollei]GET37307.1 hypothetical protein MiSe_20600 [Microseira wollei NIES-4236]
MKQKLGLTKSALLFISTLVTSLGIAASPSIAASLARSRSVFTIDYYSQSPENVPTLPEDSVEAIAEPGMSVITNGILTSAKGRASVSGTNVIAQAEAFASFFKDPLSSSNLTSNKASGSGNTYFGLAQSEAKVAGDFSIKAGETFSFDFTAFLELSTFVGNPFGEKATASGDISLVLFDITNQSVLDSFSVFSNIVTSAYAKPSEDVFGYNKSQNININFTKKFTDFGSIYKESVKASFDGSYQRSFQSDTRLLLIETKTNQVTVEAPEPSNTFALLLGFGMTGAFLGAKSKLNQQSKLFSTGTDKV